MCIELPQGVCTSAHRQAISEKSNANTNTACVLSWHKVYALVHTDKLSAWSLRQ